MRQGFLVHRGVKLPTKEFFEKRNADLDINRQLFINYEEKEINTLRMKPLSAAAFRS